VSQSDILQVYEQVNVGDRVELTHQVKVGFRQWAATTRGEVGRKTAPAAQRALSPQ